MAVFVLIHSPFAGAVTWRPTIAALEQEGHRGIAPALRHIHPPYWSKYGSLVAEAIRTRGTKEPVVLVAHSAAGLIIPAAGAALHDHGIRSYIFADATIPRKGASLGDLIPADVGIGMKEIRAQATAGLLPPWGTDWPEAAWRQLIPDDALRAEFVHELRPTPLALYEEPMSWPGTWPDAPCRYLRFSALYAEEEHEARRSGWVTRHLPGEHLHMLVRPADVAECLIELA